MALTALQIYQRAYRELALGTASSDLIASTAYDDVQLLNLMNGLGNDLVREHDWNFIQKEYTFTTVFYEYTATTAVDSTTISALSSTTGLTTNPTYFQVLGTGIDNETYLVSVNSGASTAVLSRAATASGTVTLTFCQVMYAMPTDYDRLVNNTQWDKSMHWEVIGPESGQQWQVLKSGIIATGPRARFRILGGLFQIWPAIAANRLLGFEYVSAYWVLAASAAATSKAAFTINTDTCIFPDQLMVESLKLRYCREGNSEWRLKLYLPSELSSGFVMRQLDQAKAYDKGAPLLALAPQRSRVLLSMDNVQDANFNLP